MANCPTLRNLLQGQICEENFAGLGSTAYIFLKKDLAKPLEHEGNIYKMDASSFKAGTGLFKLELKEGSQSITGESQKKRGGFKQTAQCIVEVVNEEVSDLFRALNNLDWCLIMQDGENKYQLLYSPTQKVTLDAGALKTETGAQASDDRIATIAPVLENCIYPNNFLVLDGIEIEDLYVGDDFNAAEHAGGPGNVDTVGDGSKGQFFFIADESTYGDVTAKKVSDSSAVTSGTTLGAGVQITLTAAPKTAGKFVRWSNGSTKPEITVTTTGNNEHYIAYFDAK